MRQTIEIIFEDEELIIVNKPANVLTIPDRHDADKLSVYRFLSDRSEEKIYIVHRLDRETSGILCFAKNETAHRNLSMQFEHKDVQKIYYALIDGVMHDEAGVIDKAIGEHPTIPGKMSISKKGKESLTHYAVKERFKNFTLVEADIKTGRMHQIRIHFQSIGYPLAVDSLYGRRDVFYLSELKQKKFRLGKLEEERPIISRCTLHAFRLSLLHPTTGERIEFEAEPPKDFSAVLSQLRKWGK